MDSPPAELRKVLRQQAAIAAFGTFALRQDDLLTVLTEAARVCAVGLDVPFCKVCRYREAESLVGRLIQQIDGTFELDSGHGTAWTLVFPVKPGSDPAQ